MRLGAIRSVEGILQQTAVYPRTSHQHTGSGHTILRAAHGSWVAMFHPRAGCISLYGIATVRKPAPNIGLGDRLQRLFDRGNQCLNRPRFGPPQPRFHLRPALLNGVAVRRIGRQPDEPRPACRQQGFHSRNFVGREIIPKVLDQHATRSSSLLTTQLRC